MPDTDILNEEQLKEIEARSVHQTELLKLRQVTLTPTERDALCRTLRAMWAKLDFEYHDPAGLNSLLDFAYKQRDELQAKNAALRQQLAQANASRRVHELDNHHNALVCGYCSGPLKDELLRLQTITEKL